MIYLLYTAMYGAGFGATIWVAWHAVGLDDLCEGDRLGFGIFFGVVWPAALPALLVYAILRYLRRRLDNQLPTARVVPQPKE